MGASADTDDVGVASNDIDAGHRHGNKITDDLSEAGLVSLPAWLRANDYVDQSVRGYGNLRALFRRSDGGLDVVGKTKSEQLPTFCGFAAARPEAIPVGGAHCKIHVCLVVAAIIGRAHCIGIWHGIGVNEILAT